MKINLDFINKIFSLKLKLTKESDKIKLSKYEDQIPMYDIRSHKIYPINKKNIHSRLIDYDYRFINTEVHKWLDDLYKKYPSDTRYKYNLDVIANYNIDILIDTSYKALYKYSPELGLSVSICKKESFNPFIYHLRPYYTKMELIKLGQNMGLFKNDIDPEDLNDINIHYDTCIKVSSNDVSFNEIEKHHTYIKNNNMISWVCFYSFTGSFLFNKYLRNKRTDAFRSNIRSQLNENINSIYYNGLYQIVKIMQNSPELSNDYNIYRFISDDSFIVNIKEGDTFIDKGFVSTTRDPFYSPGLNGTFGLILLKINIPKGKKGVGLFIENFSLFPKEEEFLLPPNSVFKLKSKDNNFKYYHTNPNFEKLINRKYEFDLIDTNYNEFFKNNYAPVINNINNIYHTIDSININGNTRFDIIKNFIQAYANSTKQINIKLGKKEYNFIYQWFDSSSDSSYKKFYYNKTRDGILISIFNTDGYPYINIELGNELVVGYLNTFYLGNNNMEIDNDILEIISHFGRIFYYKNAKIYHNYKSPIGDTIFSNFNQYNHTIYTYLKTKKQYLQFSPFIQYDVGYWYLDEYFNKHINDDILKKLSSLNLKNIKTNKDLYIYLIEEQFYFYPKISEMMDRNINTNTFVTFNIYDKLVAEGVANNFNENISYDMMDNIDDDFKLIFRQPIRRY